MEILNENHIPESPRPRKNTLRNDDSKLAGRLYMGIVMILAGMMLFLDSFDLLDFMGARLFHAIFSWQMLMVVIGVYLIIIKQYTPGIILTSIGVLILVAGGSVHIGKMIIPIILIAVGISLIIPKSPGAK